MRRAVRCAVFGALLLSLLYTPAPADQLVKEPNSLYICTFNIYILGKVESKYKDQDASEPIPQRIKNLAEVLAVGAFDLICIQEVRAGEIGEWAISDLVTELRNTHGLEYRHFLSESIGFGLGNMHEAIAFLYDSSVVKPEIIIGQTSLTAIVELPSRDLVRTQWTAGDFDFTLYAAHLIYGNKAKQDTCYSVLREILTTPVPSAYSADSDIVILGDFNRFGKNFNSVKNLDYHPGEFLVPNVTFFDPAVHDIKQVSEDDIAGKGVPNDDPDLLSSTVSPKCWVYDMFLLTPDVAEEFPPGDSQAVYGEDFGVICYDAPGAFGFNDETSGLGHNALKAAFSDHRPLWMRFRTNTGNSDSDVTSPEYIGTASGSKFHLPGCWTIKNSTITETWQTREAALADRQPCGVCKP